MAIRWTHYVFRMMSRVTVDVYFMIPASILLKARNLRFGFSKRPLLVKHFIIVGISQQYALIME